MFGNSSHNSIVPTDREHDEHYAHRCLECGTEFDKRRNPVALATSDGDLCEACMPDWLKELDEEGGESPQEI